MVQTLLEEAVHDGRKEGPGSEKCLRGVEDMPGVPMEAEGLSRGEVSVGEDKEVGGGEEDEAEEQRPVKVSGEPQGERAGVVQIP